MSFRLVSWNADRLLRRVPQRILSDYGDVLGPQLQNEINSSQFPWPRDTKRKNGRLVKAGKRNIVDTGEFADSQTAPQVSEVDTGVQMQIGWTAPYATDIFTGSDSADFISYQGAVTVGNQPGRDWITPALEAQPFDRYFVQRWREIDGR